MSADKYQAYKHQVTILQKPRVGSPSPIGISLADEELNSTNLTLAKSLSFIPNRAWILFLVSAKVSFYG